MLLKGPKRDQDSVTAAKIQREHLNNITRLYNEGKIKVAGPFGDGGDWLGIFIFDCETKEEVEKLLQTIWLLVQVDLLMMFDPGIPRQPVASNQEYLRRNRLTRLTRVTGLTRDFPCHPCQPRQPCQPPRRCPLFPTCSTSLLISITSTGCEKSPRSHLEK